jgi:hypothetical protein
MMLSLSKHAGSNTVRDAHTPHEIEQQTVFLLKAFCVLRILGQITGDGTSKWRHRSSSPDHATAGNRVQMRLE